MSERGCGIQRHEVEATVARVLDSLRRGAPIEDASVELKAEWPADAVRAARRLGGQANAAGGAPIYWFVGVNGKTGKVMGVDPAQKLKWLEGMKRHFDLVMPRPVHDVDLTVDEGVLCMLPFDTSDLLYMTRNPASVSGGETVEWETPWREGTRVRSARRSEVAGLLAMIAAEPVVDVLSIGATWLEAGTGNLLLNGEPALRVHAELYLAATDERPIIVPNHAATVTVQSQETGKHETRPLLSGPQFVTATVEQTGSDIRIVTGGKVLVTADFAADWLSAMPGERLDVEVRLNPLRCPRAILVATALRRCSQAKEWAVAPHGGGFV